MYNIIAFAAWCFLFELDTCVVTSINTEVNTSGKADHFAAWEKDVDYLPFTRQAPSSSLFKAFTIDKDSQSAFFFSLGMFLFVWFEAEEGVSCLVNGAKSNFFLQGKIPKWDLRLEKVQFMAG